jgi:hypothetical protein
MFTLYETAALFGDPTWDDRNFESGIVLASAVERSASCWPSLVGDGELAEEGILDREPVTLHDEP